MFINTVENNLILITESSVNLDNFQAILKHCYGKVWIL
jgi:hypothetical protein